MFDTDTCAPEVNPDVPAGLIYKASTPDTVAILLPPNAIF